ncbi:MAG: metabolite traffic protein EboE [Sphingobacteriaceae bacterium]
MQTNNGHLTYCTNIHAGESWPAHFAALKQYFPVIKKQVSPDQSMGIGLRLSHTAALELDKPENLQTFKEWLITEQAYIFTMNGFPYGGFHHTKVKEQVHAPDWTTPDRLTYTLRLFGILEQLLPDGMDGGVSTSPLSYRHWFPSAESLTQATETATLHMIRVVEQLITIRQNSGRILHLDIEPEPDGILETGAEFLQWYETVLLPLGKEQISQRLLISPEEAAVLIKDHIRLCYDVCHFAVGYEPHKEIIRTLRDKGIKIGKFQISAALKAVLNDDVSSRKPVAAAFKSYDESTYLHQVVALKKDKSLNRYKDLSEALNDMENPDVQEWRAHFHVPVFAHDLGILKSTQSDIEEILVIQKDSLQTNHLEVETYTWEVLPEALRLPIQESIIRELQWVKSKLAE